MHITLHSSLLVNKSVCSKVFCFCEGILLFVSSAKLIEEDENTTSHLLSLILPLSLVLPVCPLADQCVACEFGLWSVQIIPRSISHCYFSWCPFYTCTPVHRCQYPVHLWLVPGILYCSARVGTWCPLYTSCALVISVGLLLVCLNVPVYLCLSPRCRPGTIPLQVGKIWSIICWIMDSAVATPYGSLVKWYKPLWVFITIGLFF